MTLMWRHSSEHAYDCAAPDHDKTQEKLIVSTIFDDFGARSKAILPDIGISL